MHILPTLAAPVQPPTLQRDTEARLLVVQNILDQFFTGAATWREAAARIKVIAGQLPGTITPIYHRTSNETSHRTTEPDAC